VSSKYVTEGRALMRCPDGHRWWSPVVMGAVAKVACPRCWQEGDSIDEDEKREDWADDELLG
jgi:hypothetical protein